MDLDRKTIVSEDSYTIQTIAHYHGLKAFQRLLADAMFSASDDMESIDKHISEEYALFASEIVEYIER